MLTTDVPLDQITVDERLQMRCSAPEEAIGAYADYMLRGGADEFPPLDLFDDGEKLWLADGHLRLAAAKRAKLESFQCKIKKGSWHDAFLHALKANEAHGARRTNEDKRRAVQAALADEQLKGLSNRKIAALCNVSHEFVALQRPDTEADAEELAMLPDLSDARPGKPPRKRRVTAIERERAEHLRERAAHIQALHDTELGAWNAGKEEGEKIGFANGRNQGLTEMREAIVDVLINFGHTEIAERVRQATTQWAA